MKKLIFFLALFLTFGIASAQTPKPTQKTAPRTGVANPVKPISTTPRDTMASKPAENLKLNTDNSMRPTTINGNAQSRSSDTQNPRTNNIDASTSSSNKSSGNQTGTTKSK